MMFSVLWIFFFSLLYSGSGLNQQARHERTRYVSSRNQIYGGNFDFDEKYIPFVHFWEKPLQVLESSMKIPKKLSARPLFSWDLPVQISEYTTTAKSSTTENPSSTESIKEPEPPDTDSNAISYLTEAVQRSSSGRAKAPIAYPDSFALIPTKIKKSGNRKKSIQESEKLKEFTQGQKTSVTLKPRKKKLRRKGKGKLEKTGKRRKVSTMRRTKEMNNEVNPSLAEQLKKTSAVSEMKKEVKKEVIPPCEAMEDKCDHRCEEVNGKAICLCFRGFVLEDGRCIDINECDSDNGGCNGKCVNTIGSRKCICSKGFRLLDGSCADVNECLLRNGHGPCQDQCINTLGSYYCSCDNIPGTSLSSDQHTCEDDRSCNTTATGCSHSCINLSGRSFCTCPDGLELGDDWKTCHDIDECLNREDHDVHCEFGCVNTVGSYTCVPQVEGNST